MLRELVLAIGIPLVLLLLAVLAMEQWRDQLPAWLQRLAERPSWLWNTGVGLISRIGIGHHWDGPNPLIQFWPSPPFTSARRSDGTL
jgi:hypothetical protein